MTPGARIAAAITILDRISSGNAAEQALTTWARQSRFAGSGDRAAVRDYVFDVVRQWRSTAANGGADTGRGRMIGLLRKQGIDPAEFFTGVGHAPSPLTDAELSVTTPHDEHVALDCPDWLADDIRASLSDEFEAVMTLLQSRAPVFLRVNIAKTTRAAAQEALAADGVATRPSDLAETALEVTENPRRVQQSAAYSKGLVELQDAASQAISARVPIKPEDRVLDFCAGGGGKSLALAARSPDAHFFAHDIDPGRMVDIPNRAKRAGAMIDILTPDQLHKATPFDTVVVDAPCSGSGAWRRAPQGKWLLTPEKLSALVAVQGEILAKAAKLVSSDGTLAYMTCSLLRAENEEQVSRFVRAYPEWTIREQLGLSPTQGGDGFFLAILLRS